MDETEATRSAEALRLKNEREQVAATLEGERVEQADQLKDEREQRADKLRDEAVSTAKELAYKRGRKDERIEARFEDVEGRLDAINSSQALAATRLGGLEGSVAEIITLAKAAKKAAEDQVSARSFGIAAGGLGLGIITLVIANV